MKYSLICICSISVSLTATAGLLDKVKKGLDSAITVAESAVGEQSGSPIKVTSENPILPSSQKRITVESAQQSIDQAVSESVFPLETDNAKEVFKSMIQSLGVDLDEISENEITPYRELLTESEDLWAITYIHQYGNLVLSDKNVYLTTEKQSVHDMFSPLGVLRIPYEVFYLLKDNFLDPDEGVNVADGKVSCTMKIGDSPIISVVGHKTSVLMSSGNIFRKLDYIRQIVGKCHDLDVRNRKIKGLQEINDLGGFCGVQGGSSVEVVANALYPQLGVSFQQWNIEKKLADSYVKARKLPGVDEVDLPFVGDYSGFSFSDATTGYFSFNFIDDKLYYIERNIPRYHTFGNQTMRYKSRQVLNDPIVMFRNKLYDKDSLILKSLRKYGEPIMLMKDGARPGKIYWRWENKNGVLLVNFSSGFDELIKIFEKDYQNDYRYTLAKSSISYGLADTRGEFKVNAASYQTLSADAAIELPDCSSGRLIKYQLATKPPLPSETQKSFFLVLSDSLHAYKNEDPSIRKKYEESVHLMDEKGTLYSPVLITTKVGGNSPDIKIFCFNLPKDASRLMATVDAYNIGIMPDDQGYCLVSPTVDWEKLEQHQPKINQIIYYSKAVRDYVFAKKDAAAKEEEQLKQQEKKAAEQSLNF